MCVDKSRTKTCLVYVLGIAQRCKFQVSSFKFQVKADYRKEGQNLPNLIDRELGLIDRES